MAETYIAVTQPEIVPEEWPPKADQPVRTDMETFFPVTHEPVANAQQAVIMQGPASETPGGAPVTNVETLMTASGAPVTNDSHASVFVAQGPVPVAPSAPPQSPDVQFLRSGAPIYNDRSAGTIHHGPVLPQATPAIPAPSEAPLPQPGMVISNERNVSFVPGPAAAPPPPVFPGFPPAQAPVSNEGARHVVSAPTPFIPNGDVFIAPSAGLVQGGGGVNPDAQILPSVGQTMTADTDRTIGGGGDTTKMAGADQVSFSGQGKMDVGGTEVQTALSGDMTKVAGADDVTMTPNADAMGNQESYAGAQGEPVLNKDFKDSVEGAWGKPLKRNVS